MKRITSLLFTVHRSLFTVSLFIALLITISPGCKQDFDLTSEYKEIPVVYGLLNWQESNHYIRIQKGFLIDGNARLAAGIADSVYYTDSLTVKLIAYRNSTVFGAPILLHKVDGNLIGLPKDSGLFINSPNILYTFSGNLDPAKRYKLQVTNNRTGLSFESQKTNNLEGIGLVQDFEISSPRKALHDYDKLNLQNTSPARIRWINAENAGIYDLTVRFYYREFKLSDNSLLKDTFLDMPILRSSIGTFDVQFTSKLVLSYLAQNIKPDLEVYREFNQAKGMEFKFSAGGTELAGFFNSQLAQSGLGSNEALPPYTNIFNGVGLISSRYYKEVDSVLLSDLGLDSLACSDISRSLRFKNHSGQICN